MVERAAQIIPLGEGVTWVHLRITWFQTHPQAGVVRSHLFEVLWHSAKPTRWLLRMPWMGGILEVENHSWTPWMTWIVVDHQVRIIVLTQVAVSDQDHLVNLEFEIWLPPLAIIFRVPQISSHWINEGVAHQVQCLPRLLSPWTMAHIIGKGHYSTVVGDYRCIVIESAYIFFCCQPHCGIGFHERS